MLSARSSQCYKILVYVYSYVYNIFDKVRTDIFDRVLHT